MTPDYQQAINYAIDRLTSELSPRLTYHNLWHTEEEVMPTSVRIAKAAGVTGRDLRLVAVAAAFHDIGFLEDYYDHETAGIRIVTRILPRFDFTVSDIKTISGMINATRMPQTPQNLCDASLADADLDLLGREDFMARNRALRQELANHGRPLADKSWYEGQIAFVRNHSYFITAQKVLRKEGKERNIQELKALLY